MRDQGILLKSLSKGNNWVTEYIRNNITEYGRILNFSTESKTVLESRTATTVFRRYSNHRTQDRISYRKLFEKVLKSFGHLQKEIWKSDEKPGPSLASRQPNAAIAVRLAIVRWAPAEY